MTSTSALRDLLFEKPLTAADIRTLHQMLVTAPPAIARILLLAILLQADLATARPSAKRG